jgi:hypothetical protein
MTALRKIHARRYIEILDCGHYITWERPSPGMGGKEWPKLVQRRRCKMCEAGHAAISGFYR